MPSISLQLTPTDYQHAAQLVYRSALKLQPVKPLAKVLLAGTSALYMGALFTIATAPNNLDLATLRLLRGSALALVIAPLLFLVGLALARRQSLQAAIAAQPTPPETLQIAAEPEGLFVVTPGVRTEYSWSAVSLVVEGSDFSALALSRAAPIPLPARAFQSPEDYFAFLRQAQDLTRRGAA